MLSPEYYEGCADDIIELYEQLEDDIISDVVRRIVKTGKVTETAKHQIEQLQESGLLYDDILNIIAGQTDATSQHVKALFEDAGVETVSIDNEVYHENGLTPVDIRQSPAMRQTLEAGYRKTLGNMKNLTLTTANTSQTAYINACNQAYMQVTSGAFSYQEAIKQAVQMTAKNGATVLYPSGHTERLDVAVRRAVLTGVGQTCREIGIMNAEECGCDLMEISAHSGARPDHAKWQGQFVSLSGKNAGRTISGKKVLTLRQIGYGQGDGFGGWNCRHDWYPFFEEYSTPNYSKKELQRLDEKNIMYNGKLYNQYEISQIQRRYEREIRSAKREQVAFKTALEETDDPDLKQVMQDSLNYANSLVKDKQAKMRDFIRQTGQDRDYFREQNYPKENSRNSLTLVLNNGKINNKDLILSPDKREKKVIDGVHQKFPLRIKQALKSNPNYGKLGYDVNCQRCVQAYELRRRGYKVIAQPCLSNENGLGWGSAIFKNCTGTSEDYTLFLTADEVKKELENAPSGSRYNIYISWKDEDGAHVFIAEKRGKKIFYLDPQTNEDDVEYYFSMGEDGCFGFFRMDDKELKDDDSILNAVVKNEKYNERK